MTNNASKNEYDTVWRFHCDPQKGEYSLTIEFHSDFNPADHETIHKKLMDEAADWLIKKGMAPDKVAIRIERGPFEKDIRKVAGENTDTAVIPYQNLHETNN